MPETSEWKICRACGEIFYRTDKYNDYTWEIKRYCDFFCSKDSWNRKASAIKKRRARVVVEDKSQYRYCVNCGKAIYRNNHCSDYHWKIRRFCNTMCMTEYQRKEYAWKREQSGKPYHPKPWNQEEKAEWSG